MKKENVRNKEWVFCVAGRGAFFLSVYQRVS